MRSVQFSSFIMGGTTLTSASVSGMRIVYHAKGQYGFLVPELRGPIAKMAGTVFRMRAVEYIGGRNCI